MAEVFECKLFEFNLNILSASFDPSFSSFYPSTLNMASPKDQWYYLNVGPKGEFGALLRIQMSLADGVTFVVTDYSLLCTSF